MPAAIVLELMLVAVLAKTATEAAAAAVQVM
jgi:hypothetical protein